MIQQTLTEYIDYKLEEISLISDLNKKMKDCPPDDLKEVFCPEFEKLKGLLRIINTIWENDIEGKVMSEHNLELKRIAVLNDVIISQYNKLWSTITSRSDFSFYMKNV